MKKTKNSKANKLEPQHINAETVSRTGTEAKKTKKRRERATLTLARKIRAVRLFLCLTHGELLARVLPDENPLPLRPMLSNWEAGKREPPRRYLVGLARLARLSLDKLLDDEIELAPPIRLYENVEKVSFTGEHLVYYWKDDRLPADWQPINEREHHAPGTCPARQPPVSQSNDAAEQPVRAINETAQSFAEITLETNDQKIERANEETNEPPLIDDGKTRLPNEHHCGDHLTDDARRNDLIVLSPENVECEEEEEELEEITLKLPVAVIDRLHDAHLRQLLAIPRRHRAAWSLDCFVGDLLKLPVSAPEINDPSEYYNGDVNNGGNGGDVGNEGENYINQR